LPGCVVSTITTRTFSNMRYPNSGIESALV
jgi:hypothetical protein